MRMTQRKQDRIVKVLTDGGVFPAFISWDRDKDDILYVAATTEREGKGAVVNFRFHDFSEHDDFEGLLENMAEALPAAIKAVLKAEETGVMEYDGPPLPFHDGVQGKATVVRAKMEDILPKHVLDGLWPDREEDKLDEDVVGKLTEVDMNEAAKILKKIFGGIDDCPCPNCVARRAQTAKFENDAKRNLN